MKHVTFCYNLFFIIYLCFRCPSSSRAHKSVLLSFSKNTVWYFKCDQVFFICCVEVDLLLCFVHFILFFKHFLHSPSEEGLRFRWGSYSCFHGDMLRGCHILVSNVRSKCSYFYQKRKINCAFMIRLLPFSSILHKEKMEV